MPTRVNGRVAVRVRARIRVSGLFVECWPVCLSDPGRHMSDRRVWCLEGGLELSEAILLFVA